ncbi:Retrovirus-related Pol polyprotein from transposon TNT 1-94 [Yarrowia sp. C11]|nr:Retrovirus-related Pol polyprotein from transposon TNT 1-94 [Yarrowia sp. C11]
MSDNIKEGMEKLSLEEIRDVAITDEECNALLEKCRLPDVDGKPDYDLIKYQALLITIQHNKTVSDELRVKQRGGTPRQGSDDSVTVGSNLTPRDDGIPIRIGHWMDNTYPSVLAAQQKKIKEALRNKPQETYGMKKTLDPLKEFTVDYSVNLWDSSLTHVPDDYVKYVSTNESVLGYGNISFSITAVIGKVEEKTFITLRNVQWAPWLALNLLSVEQLTASDEYSLIKSGKSYLFHGPGFTCQLATTDETLNLPVLTCTPILKHSAVTELLIPHPRLGKSEVVHRRANLTMTEQLVHKRLAHPCEAVLKKTVHLADGLEGAKPHEAKGGCIACGRNAQASRRKVTGLSKPTRPWQTISVDLVFESIISSMGFKYYLVIKDQYSLYLTVYLLRTKDETVLVLKQFLKWVETQFKSPHNYSVSKVWSDEGSEITTTFKQELISMGLEVSTVPTGEHQANGSVESTIGKLRKDTRVLLLEGNLPLRLWDFAVLHAVSLYNVTWHSTTDQIPHTTIWGQRPDLSQVRIFGCVCYAQMPESHRIFKAADTALMGIYVGHVQHGKYYLVWEPWSGSIIQTHNVIFKEFRRLPDYMNVQKDLDAPRLICKPGVVNPRSDAPAGNLVPDTNNRHNYPRTGNAQAFNDVGSPENSGFQAKGKRAKPQSAPPDKGRVDDPLPSMGSSEFSMAHDAMYDGLDASAFDSKKQRTEGYNLNFTPPPGYWKNPIIGDCQNPLHPNPGCTTAGQPTVSAASTGVRVDFSQRVRCPASNFGDPEVASAFTDEEVCFDDSNTAQPMNARIPRAVADLSNAQPEVRWAPANVFPCTHDAETMPGSSKYHSTAPVHTCEKSQEAPDLSSSDAGGLATPDNSGQETISDILLNNDRLTDLGLTTEIRVGYSAPTQPISPSADADSAGLSTSAKGPSKAKSSGKNKGSAPSGKKRGRPPKKSVKDDAPREASPGVDDISGDAPAAEPEATQPAEAAAQPVVSDDRGSADSTSNDGGNSGSHLSEVLSHSSPGAKGTKRPLTHSSPSTRPHKRPVSESVYRRRQILDSGIILDAVGVPDHTGPSQQQKTRKRMARELDNLANDATDNLVGKMYDIRRKRRKKAVEMEKELTVQGMVARVAKAKRMTVLVTHVDPEAGTVLDYVTTTVNDESVTKSGKAAVEVKIPSVVAPGDQGTVTYQLSTEKPVTFQQAIKSPARKLWQEAMGEEMKQIHKNDVFDLIKVEEVPKGAKLISAKWVYDIKYGLDGGIERYKARLVARGFEQEAGIDYTLSFSPVIRFESVRFLLAMAANYNWAVHQMDVKTAFLYGVLDEPVYLTPPPGTDKGKLQTQVQKSKLGALGHMPGKKKPTEIWRLKKSLYGLVQAPRCWNQTLHKSLLELNLVRHQTEHGLYSNAAKTVFLGVYVDDILITGSDASGVADLKTKLSKVYEMKDLGEVEKFLGMHVKRDGKSGSFTIDMEQYITKMECELKLNSQDKVDSPLTQVLTKNCRLEESTAKKVDATFYRQCIGKLSFLAHSVRLDIAFAVNFLATFNQEPMEVHMKALNRVMNYVCKTKKFALKYSGTKSDLCPTIYTDANWGIGYPECDRTYEGMVVMMCGGPICWRSAKQKSISLSTAEAEYMGLSEGAKTGIWLRQVLEECNLGIPESQPLVIYTDNQAALQISTHPAFYPRTKHIARRFHYTREEVERKTIDVQYISTEQQLADILTKALNDADHEKAVRALGICDSGVSALQG